MKRIGFYTLLMSCKLFTIAYAQTLEKKWGDIRRMSWEYDKSAYMYSYLSSDSSSVVDFEYDSLDHVKHIYTYYGDSLIADPNDSTHSGLITKYKKNGTFINFYENQKVKSIENYFLGIPIGRWIKYFPNGEIWTIQNYPRDSSIYLLCEKYTIVTTNGSGGITISGLLNTTSVPHGEWIEFYSNGNVKEKKNFHMGLEIGKWEWYYGNGIKKKEGCYFEDYLENYPCYIKVIDDDLIDEEQEEVYAVDHVYVHIRPKHGLWKYWDEKGNLIKEEIYDQGKLVRPKKKESAKK